MTQAPTRSGTVGPLVASFSGVFDALHPSIGAERRCYCAHRLQDCPWHIIQIQATVACGTGLPFDCFSRQVPRNGLQPNHSRTLFTWLDFSSGFSFSPFGLHAFPVHLGTSTHLDFVPLPRRALSSPCPHTAPRQPQALSKRNPRMACVEVHTKTKPTDSRFPESSESRER